MSKSSIERMMKDLKKMYDVLKIDQESNYMINNKII
jgi:hypothetical protein